MIHYTLLPKNEIKSLRKEYRIRLFITFCLFASIAIILGIASLVPSYFFSKTQESQAVQFSSDFEKNSQASGFDQIQKDLASSQTTVKELTADSTTKRYSTIIQNIAKYHTSSVSITSFDTTGGNAGGNDSATTTTVIIQGKALTRDDLIAFQNSLENDSHFTEVQLPISDLTQSKNIAFAIRLIALN